MASMEVTPRVEPVDWFLRAIMLGCSISGFYISRQEAMASQVRVSFGAKGGSSLTLSSQTHNSNLRRVKWPGKPP